MRAVVRAPLAWLLLLFSTLYLVTLFPGVGGIINHGDSAKFQFIGKVVGISHPPGNPLYMLLNAGWARLPLPCRLFTKASLLSTFSGVMTLAYVYRTLARLFDSRAGLAGAVALGTGSLFWIFATEPEVYTLNTFLLAAACYYAAVFAETGEEKPFLAGALFISLGFANHLTSAMLLPGAAFLVFVRLRQGADLRRRDVGIVLAFILLSASFYLYIPWRIHAGAAYNEFDEPLTWASFWNYITAKKFQDSFVHLTFEAGVRDRLPVIMQLLQRQWIWPLLFVIPTGMLALWKRAPLFAAFVGMSLVGLLVFAFEYDIEDPDGFYMPVVLLLSFGIGGAMAAAEKKLPRARWVALGALLAIPAAVHVMAWSRKSGFELVEGIDGQEKPVLWNLDDLFTQIPEGAKFAVPCAHYGCVEVLNYYRFGETVLDAKHVEYVRFSNLDTGYWDDKVAVVEFDRAKDQTICSIRKDDALAMRAKRARVDENLRPTLDVREGTLQGAVLYCSRPEQRSPPR
jgi:hypothetical protein